uniref:Uncharacterized protein n=1 Tax=Rhizophora mucronata TaxID=61149 RepID=A0A2P2PIY4_RHIMU
MPSLGISKSTSLLSIPSLTSSLETTISISGVASIIVSPVILC